MVNIRQDWDSSPLFRPLGFARASSDGAESAIARVRAMVQNMADELRRPSGDGIPLHQAEIGFRSKVCGP
jgi:hypothetical protein